MSKTKPRQKTMRDYLSSPGPSHFTVHRSSNVKPKSLLQRIREKEAALKEEELRRDPHCERRRDIVNVLRRSMVEVIFSHYNIKRVRGMELNTLRSLVVTSCGEMTRSSFSENISLLCELCPDFCTVESYLGKNCLKLTDVGHVDEVLRRLDEELARLGSG